MSATGTPWDSPSRYGRAGVAARSALQRALRPLTVRIEEEHTALRRQLADLQARAEADARRQDHLEAQLRVADATLGALLVRDLPPGTRIHRSLGAGRRRAICSLATGTPYRSLLARSALSYERYAEKWGWDLVLSTEDLADGRPAPWGKIPLLRSLLDDYDWILFLDADVVITDLEADIAQLIRADKDLYLVEHQWLGQYTANTGVMLMRSGDWMRSLLDAVWAATEYIDHPFWENAAALALLGYGLDPARLVAPTHWMARTELIDRRWNAIDLEPPARPAFIHRGFFDVERRIEQVTADLECALGGADPGGWLPLRVYEPS